MRQLQLERATLSIIIGTLVRKELVEQLPDKNDLRQKQLRITPAGKYAGKETASGCHSRGRRYLRC